MPLKSKIKGLTLIELIVSIALIGMLSVVFFSMFLFGYKSIKSAGNKSGAAFKAQANIEEVINDKPSAGNAENSNLRITFGDSTYINIEGKIETQSQSISNSTAEFTIFNPVN